MISFSCKQFKAQVRLSEQLADEIRCIFSSIFLAAPKNTRHRNNAGDMLTQKYPFSGKTQFFTARGSYLVLIST
ncbi:hypothetical protein EUGRSUZ_J02794 [Eucalyptus grandis]|uniref:Uncharacterized protein n=2 Tax=Eucalyptus grandis TaxID=71139 RepID=A0ACC3JAD5_EUCGR|nr:hypothetical protein EUGRSUZ_J02794 [Eucalyptus grandis]